MMFNVAITSTGRGSRRGWDGEKEEKERESYNSQLLLAFIRDVMNAV